MERKQSYGPGRCWTIRWARNFLPPPSGGALGLEGQKVCTHGQFHHLDSGVKGITVNIYGPNSFLEKQYFIEFLNWTKNQSKGGSWVMGGDFNLIANLGEKKGGR